jgi:hypothetical protein
MDCDRFGRWLDEGMDDASAASARAHAASCARCGAALAVARALDATLGRSAVAAPAGFAARVMERVARARLAHLLVWIEPDALPWWVRTAAEPVTALSLTLGALVLWQYPALARFAAAALQGLANPALGTFVRQVAAPRLTLDLALLMDPFVFAGVVLAGLPLAWWAGLAVYHWSGDPQAFRAARR